MDRKEFISQVGFGAASLITAACFGSLAGCQKTDASSAPTNVDFTVDTASGSLATNGGYLVKNGVLVARTNSGTFLAVSAACTHEGTTINYYASSNSFTCPNHGAQFTNKGVVTNGPAKSNLTTYNTTLSGTSLRVYS